MTVPPRQCSRGYSLVLCIVILVLAALSLPARLEAAGDMKYEREAAKGINEFAIDMYLELVKGEKGNVLFSPQSISEAVAMVYAGASGENAKEMAKVMHFGPNVHKGMGLLERYLEQGKGSGPFVNVANAVWPAASKHYKLTDSFSKIMKDHYRSEIQLLDYAANPEKARGTINRWVEKKTNNRIKDILPPGAVRRDTPMVLASATYFLGKWASPFDKAATKKEPFFLENGSSKTRTVKLMHQKTNVIYDATEEAQVICMAYKDLKYAMIFALPAKGISLAQYEKTLQRGKNRDQLQRLIDAQGGYGPVYVYIPKFHVEKKYTLKGPLFGLGMKIAFVGNGFHNLMVYHKSGEPFPYGIEEIYHQTFIDLDEEKTEAAAATVITGYVGTPPPSLPGPPTFRADRPFIYLLVEKKTGTILFMGRFCGPE